MNSRDRTGMFILLGLALLSAAGEATARELPDWLALRFDESVRWEELSVPELPPDRRSAHDDAGYGFIRRLSRVKVSIDEMGNVVEHHVEVREFFTESGAQAAGNGQIGLRPAFEEVKILSAYTLVSEGGTPNQVAPESIQIVNENSYDIFSDAATIVIPFVRLGPGARSVLVFEKTVRNSDWPLPWSRMFWPQSWVPTEHYEVEVAWDASVSQPAWMSTSELVTCETVSAGMARCVGKQIPAIKEDPDVASWEDVVPLIVIAERVRWSDMARAEAELVEESISTLDGGGPNVERMSVEKRLETLYRFVADEVRYVAFEGGVGAVAPRPAALTLERRYGDCKDKVALFVALARNAGLKAYAVLVGSSRYDRSQLVLPSWKWFDHMIACVDGLGPAPVCLELTTPHAAVGELPMGLHGAVKLDLKSSAGASVDPGQLERPLEAWTVKAQTTNHIGCDGTVEEETQIAYSKGFAIWMRELLSGKTAQERQDFLQGLYLEATGLDAKPHFSIRGLEDRQGSIVIAATHLHTGLGDTTAWTHYGDSDPWLLYHLRGMMTENQHHPYRLNGGRMIVENHYSVCDAIEIWNAGPEIDLVAEDGFFRREYKANPRWIKVASEIRIPSQQIPVDEISGFSRFLDALAKSTPITFGLRGGE